LNGHRKLVLISLIISASAYASPNASDILRKSYAAENQVTFSGRLTTTVYRGGAAASAEVNVFRSGRRSRMEYVTGPSAGTVIIDDGSSMIRLDSSARTAYVSQIPNAPERLGLLMSNYAPVMIGTSRIAGRECYELKLGPKCKCEPSKKLWIDKQSQVALKTEGYGSDGRIASSTAYSRIDYSARPSATLFQIPRGWQAVRTAAESAVGLDAVRKAVGFTPVKPGYVPKGYRFDDYYVRNMPKCAPFAGLRYANGLNTISVFERKGGCFGPGFRCGRGRGGPGCGRGMGCGRAGAGCCVLMDDPQARMAHTIAGDLTVIIVGDIAASELQKMGNSFR